LAIPSTAWRLRLACIWPIWIGLKTIALLRRGNPLDPGRVIRVPQAQTNWLLAKSVVLCRCDTLLDKAHRGIRHPAASQ
jgi:farnesyl-diphosphate farnesyltransferase